MDEVVSLDAAHYTLISWPFFYIELQAASLALGMETRQQIRRLDA